jgi:hypothetical protein
MREYLLQETGFGQVIINGLNNTPYRYLYKDNGLDFNGIKNSQEGLGIKTYQSDLFNNWLSTEWIDGVNGISSITAIDTSDGNFTIDTLNLSKKVYDMLNRIAVSGGTYDDWLDTVYTHERYTRCETPMYMGGLIKELAFQEVVSTVNSSAEGENSSAPLGTLAGKGVMTKKNKGGNIDIRIDGTPIIIYEFFNGVGYSNSSLSAPTPNDWLNGLYDALVGLLDYGLDYIIDTNDQTITIYNNNCLPLNITQNFEINVGINFDILCNP